MSYKIFFLIFSDKLKQHRKSTKGKNSYDFQWPLKTNLALQQLSVPVNRFCVLVSYSNKAKRQTSQLLRQGNTL